MKLIMANTLMYTEKLAHICAANFSLIYLHIKLVRHVLLGQTHERPQVPRKHGWQVPFIIWNESV